MNYYFQKILTILNNIQICRKKATYVRIADKNVKLNQRQNSQET